MSRILIEYNGKIQTMADWAREFGLPYGAVKSRHRHGVRPPKLFESIQIVRPPWSAERKLKKSQQATKHGCAKDDKQTTEYRAWQDMKNRCDNPSIKNYRLYGARGIAYCERWKSFDLFLADMGRKPSKRHSLGRKENDGNYCPENCRWETREEQDNNRRDNVIVEYKGERLTLTRWARKLGYSRNTIHGRYRRGWSDVQIIEGISPSGKKLPTKNSKRKNF